MKLDTEQLSLDGGLSHKRFDQLQESNHNPEYKDLGLVESESSGSVYLVGRVECLAVPFEDADAVADTIEVWLCNCGDGWYRKSNGPPDGVIDPTEFSHCKHVEKYK